jgi:UDPglucose 6-dehydrogenase
MKRKNANIGIVGYGFVGKAIAHGFIGCDPVIADPALGTSCRDLIQSNIKFDSIFVAVPTAMGEDGKIDSSIVEKVLEELKGLDTLLVLKSTVTPDIIKVLAEKYKNFVYNPEFLTEANALNDFVDPIMHVMGGSWENCEDLMDIYDAYSECKKGCRVLYMTAVEASFVKYTMNSFLASKVLFFNQINELCSEHSADYGRVIEAVGNDPRIGKSHTMVPGPDGRRGAAGPCFSKDSSAFIHFSKNKLSILREAWNYNVDIRNNYGEPLPREVEQHVSFNKI